MPIARKLGLHADFCEQRGQRGRAAEVQRTECGIDPRALYQLVINSVGVEKLFFTKLAKTKLL